MRVRARVLAVGAAVVLGWSLVPMAVSSAATRAERAEVAAAVAQLRADGVLAGCGRGDGTCADDPVTRGQLALLLDRLTGRGAVPPSVDAATVGGSGPDGLRGPQGPAGPRGAAGSDGAAGQAGRAGADGAQGPAGATGADGAAGATGAPGQAGRPGIDYTRTVVVSPTGDPQESARRLQAATTQVAARGEGWQVLVESGTYAFTDTTWFLTKGVDVRGLDRDGVVVSGNTDLVAIARDGGGSLTSMTLVQASGRLTALSVQSDLVLDDVVVDASRGAGAQVAVLVGTLGVPDGTGSLRATRTELRTGPFPTALLVGQGGSASSVDLRHSTAAGLIEVGPASTARLAHVLLPGASARVDAGGRARCVHVFDDAARPFGADCGGPA